MTYDCEIGKRSLSGTLLRGARLQKESKKEDRVVNFPKNCSTTNPLPAAELKKVDIIETFEFCKTFASFRFRDEKS